VRNVVAVDVDVDVRGTTKSGRVKVLSPSLEGGMVSFISGDSMNRRNTSFTKFFYDMNEKAKCFGMYFSSKKGP
jgi:hypothetical protein